MKRKRYTAVAAQKIYEGFKQSGLTQRGYAMQVGIPQSTFSHIIVSASRAEKIAKAMVAEAAGKAPPARALKLAPKAAGEGNMVEALARENAALKRLLASNWGYSQAG